MLPIIQLVPHILQHIQNLLEGLGAYRQLVLALSGGCDSMVLLDVLATLRAQAHTLGTEAVPVSAVHVNHHLHPLADEWAAFCRRRCQDYAIPLAICDVSVSRQGASIEATARDARYHALQSFMQTGTVCLMAHHEDDQAETLLLQCLRGSGPRGLSAMPVVAPFAMGRLFRPLLGISRADIQAYAQTKALTWIEDPSNSDLRFDRNFLRSQIMPLLKTRWPSCTKTLVRSAQLCAESVALNEETIAQALNQVQLTAHTALSISRLMALTPPLQAEVIRAWLRARHYALPQQQHCQQIQALLLTAKHNPLARVCWDNLSARRYRDALWIEPETFFSSNVSAGDECIWRGEASIALPGDLGRLHIQETQGQGLLHRDQYTIRFRQEGQRFHPSQRQGSHPLKKCFQEWGVPPWLRDRVPLIYHGTELVAVVGYAVSEHYLARNEQKGLLFYTSLC